MMRFSTLATLVTVALASRAVLVTGFSSTALHTALQRPLRSATTKSTSLSMAMDLAQKKDRLPPPLEDQLTLSGDIASLFIYSFLDHSMNDLYVETIQNSGVDSAKNLDPTNEYGIAAHIPVWFDHAHTMIQQDQLLTLLSIPHVNYAPALQTAGMASILMTSCWLFCGWLSGAFLFQNTLECHTTRMLYVTGKTWLMTAASLVFLALASDWMQTADMVNPPLGGLTKADGDYIFDSLTVLVTWRFMVSMMLGGLTKK